MDEETKANGLYVTCLRRHSYLTVELGLETSILIPHSISRYHTFILDEEPLNL